MSATSRDYWRRQARRTRFVRWLGRVSIVPTAMLATMGGALALLALEDAGLSQWLTASRPVATTSVPGDVLLRQFASCTQARYTCIVDGDTFWLDGVKYRIADINTPEISSPQCGHEAELGRKATDRLTQLLNEGPFSLAPIERDVDQYGRKLRIVMRDGQSVGAQLVAEGLAHQWQGYRQDWC